MKKIVLAACLAAFALMTGPVMAQSKTAEEQMNLPKGSKGAATKEEKAAAKEKRKAEGKQVKAETPGASDEAMSRKTGGTAKAATKEQKAEAKATRNVKAADALKKGEIPSGTK